MYKIKVLFNLKKGFKNIWHPLFGSAATFFHFSLILFLLLIFFHMETVETLSMECHPAVNTAEV